MADDLFWNLSNGIRPLEPVPGLYTKICADLDRHVYDDYYGPLECARCGHRTPSRARTKFGRLGRLLTGKS